MCEYSVPRTPVVGVDPMHCLIPTGRQDHLYSIGSDCSFRESGLYRIACEKLGKIPRISRISVLVVKRSIRRTYCNHNHRHCVTWLQSCSKPNFHRAAKWPTRPRHETPPLAFTLNERPTTGYPKRWVVISATVRFRRRIALTE